MKIYFTTGYENPKKSEKNIKVITDWIKKNDHNLLKRPFKSEYGSDIYNVEEQKYTDIFDFLDKSVESIYKQATKRIKTADVVVAEASHFLSPGLGFELGLAIHEKKPVLVLVNSESKVVMSEVIEGNPSRYFSMEKYHSQKELVKLLDNFSEKAKGQLDTKFILIISPEIDKYLEWAATNKRMHKAQVVRNAIEDKIEDDEEYKKYLTDTI